MTTNRRLQKKAVRAYNFYRILIIIMLAFAVALQGGLNPYDFLKQEKTPPSFGLQKMRQIFPTASSYQIEPDAAYTILSLIGDTLGQIIPTYTKTEMTTGFAGKVPLLIGIDKSNRIRGMAMLRHHESEEYMEYIIADSLLSKWDLLTVTEALRLEVDAVTSATETSEAMIKDIRNTFSAYSGIDINHQQASSSDILAIILLISLFGFGLMVCFVRSFKKFRFILLIAVAIIMGFIYQSMLSAALIHGWLVNGFPWRSSFPMVLLLILSILIPMLSRKNYYCHYMCPYGAVQEIAGRISPFKKKPLVRMKLLHMPVRNIIFGMLLFGLLIGHHPELSLIEPFSSFSIRVVSWGMLAFGILFIAASFFLNKPWCSFCPTGYFLDSCKKCNIIPSKKTK